MKIQHTIIAPRARAPGHRTYLNDTMIHHRSNPTLLKAIDRARDWTGANIRISQ